MSKYIVKNPVYSCPHCNLISESESEIDDCVKKHEFRIRESLEVSKFYNFLKSKTIDVFEATLNANVASVCPGISKLEKLKEALIKLAKSVGFELSFTTFSYKHIDYEYKIIKFNAMGDLKRINNFSIDSFFDDSEYSLNDLDLKSKYSNIENRNLLYFIRDALIKKKVYFKDLLNVCNMESSTNQHDSAIDSIIYYKYGKDNLINSEIEEYSNLLASSKEKNLKRLELYSKYRRDRFPSILISDVIYSVQASMLKSLEEEWEALSERIDNLRSLIQERSEYLLDQDSANIPMPDSSYDFDEEKLNIFKDIFSNKLK